MAKKKRLKKKQTRQRVEQKLLQQGYSKKEIKNLPKQEKIKAEKNIKRNDDRNLKRKKNRNYIKKHNLTETYKHNGVEYKGSRLVDLSPEVLQKFATQQKNREYKRDLRNRYKQKLIDSGLPEHLADKYKYKNKDIVNEVVFKGDRTIYKTDKSLTVLWSDVTGESHYEVALTQFNDKTTKEMITQIHEEYQIAKEGNTPKYREEKYFLGVAYIEISRDENKLQRHAKRKMRNSRYHNGHVKKGYKGLGVAEDGHFLTSNEFTVRGYANMMLSIMTRAKPEHVVQYYNELETYAKRNLPEIHKQIFE